MIQTKIFNSILKRFQTLKYISKCYEKSRNVNLFMNKAKNIRKLIIVQGHN